MSDFGKNRSIKEKLIYSCLIITIIPMVILESVFGIQTKNSEYKRRINAAEIFADNLIENFTFEIEKAELIANNLADFIPLDIYLDTHFTDYHEQFNYYVSVIHPMVAGYNNSKGNTRVRVYHNKNIKNYSLELNNGLDQFTKNNFSGDPFVKGSSFWIHLDCYPFHPVLSYFRTVQDRITNYNTSYVASVHLKEKAFHGYIEMEPVENTLVILTDGDGNILTSNEQAYSGENFNKLECSQNSMEDLLSKNEVTISGEKYYVVGRKTNLLSLAVLVPDRNLKEELVSSVTSFVLIGCLLLIVAVVLVSYSTGRITNGISRLMDKMHNVSRTSIHSLANDNASENSRDEIIQLDAAFTKMMRRIDDLVDKVEDDERKLKDEVILRQQAELIMLQQQINPHYLFNTLEAVRMKLVIKNDYENAEIIKLFAEGFRRYINVKQEDATLFEEAAFIKNYIYIQNYRLGNIIHYCLEARETVLSYRIPKLLIQPVVENCILHGFENRPNGGKIVLNIIKADNFLFIRVSDNGDGMDREKLAELRKHIYNQVNNRSVGLQNVYQRLKLYYGNRADLVIESTKGKGSTVTMRIPLKEAQSVQSITGR